jgi:hypothetical protein
LEINSFFTWHIVLEVGKTQDLLSKIWQTFRDALDGGTVVEDLFCFAKKVTMTTWDGKLLENARSE